MAIISLALFKCLLPQWLAEVGHPYGGSRMLLRSLVNPKTFNEKIQRSKLLNRDPRLPQREDKILVKDFVKKKLGAEWVSPTLWHGEVLPPLDQRSWPVPFVIKANNGCGWNIFVRDKSEIDWPRIENAVAEWRRAPFGANMGEWLYSKIKPALLVEPFIGERESLPVDYKLWTFSGRAHLIEVVSDRERELKSTMFDTNWHRLPFSHGYASDPRDIAPPVSLERMIKAAERLAEDFPFVRVDFYEIGNQPRFGEFSFYPGSGLDLFDPPEWDTRIGRLWR
jgi:TupA-like ATPgrasp